MKTKGYHAIRRTTVAKEAIDFEKFLLGEEVRLSKPARKYLRLCIGSAFTEAWYRGKQAR